MLDLIHDVTQPEFHLTQQSRLQQRTDDPQNDDKWDEAIFVSALELSSDINGATANNHTDLVQRYAAWTRGKCYEHVREVLLRTLSIEQARQALLFLIEQEKR